jgi:anti-anti-sigma factor
MPLEITSREQEGIRILSLKGHLTFGPTDLDFLNELDRLVKAGEIRIVINLTGLTELDSTGVDTLLETLARLREAGGDLALVNLHASHIKAFAEARLDLSFFVFHDEENAVNSFFPGRETKRWDVLEFVQSQLRKSEKS